MRLFIKTACFVAFLNMAAAADLQDECATALNLDGEHFTNETLFEGSVEPFDMSVDDETGDIFYIDSSKLFVLKNGSSEPLEIEGVSGVPYAIAVDNDHGLVDFSIGDKLYTYNRDTNTPVVHDDDTVKHDPIVHMFYTNDTRYVSTGTKLYNLTINGREQLDRDLYNGDKLVVDSEGNFYFLANCGSPFVTPEGATEKDPLEIPGFKKTDSTLFTIDRQDNVYLIVNKQLYRVTADTNFPQLIASLNVEPISIAFDKFNNPIVGTKGSIIKFNHIDC